MKPTDFATHLTEFLSVYLPRQKNSSRNTITSYRDTFKLLIRYCQEQRHIPVEKLNLDMLNHGLIADFLDWLEKNANAVFQLEITGLQPYILFFVMPSMKNRQEFFISKR